MKRSTSKSVILNQSRNDTTYQDTSFESTSLGHRRPSRLNPLHSLEQPPSDFSTSSVNLQGNQGKTYSEGKKAASRIKQEGRKKTQMVLPEIRKSYQ